MFKFISFANQPIKQKLRWIILLTSLIVLGLTSGAFIAYEVFAARRNLVEHVERLGRVLAAGTTAALAFGGEFERNQLLATLEGDTDIVSACLYDKTGRPLASWPQDPAQFCSATPEAAGHRFESGILVCVTPIVAQGTNNLGTLTLRATLVPLYKDFALYAGIVATVLSGAVLVAFLLSNRLQQRISDPILALTRAAQAVSQGKEYWFTAKKISEDEIGTLADSFNEMLREIRERDRALRANQDRLDLALQASQTGVWDWNIVNDRVSWDDYFFRLIGTKSFQGKFDDFLEMIHPDDRKGVAKAAHRAANEGSALHTEFRLARPDGRTRQFVLKGSTVRDDQQRPAGMAGVVIDITEARRAEEARRESESLLRAVVETTVEGIITTDEEGVIRTVNPAGELIFGYGAAELTGLHVSILGPERPFEQESHLARYFQPADRRVVRIGNEVHGRRKDGSVFSLELSLTESQIGSARIFTAMFRDVTTRKQAEFALRQSEERYRSLIAATSSVVYTCDPAGAFITRQASWQSYTGQDWQDQKGWGWLQMLHPDDREAFQERWAEAIPGKDAFQSEGRLWHAASGGYRHCASRTVPLLAQDNSIREWIGTLTDVHDRRQAEEEILRLNARLEERVRERTAKLQESTRELESFTHTVSHDLRAPLRHIDGFAKLLQEQLEGESDPEAPRYCEKIRSSAQNLGALIDGLLNLWRIGRHELRLQSTPVGALAERVINELRPETEQRRIEWRVQPLPTISCDPELMLQVFAHLLSNAVKFTRGREPSVIEVGYAEVGGEKRLFVRDNGVGFNMKYADKLFAIFQRLHRAEQFEGTGIGLVTVHRIIRLHGGHVWAEAELDKGATFWFTVGQDAGA